MTADRTRHEDGMTLPRTLALLPIALSIACVVPTKPLGGADSEDDGGDGMPTSSDDDPSAGSDSLSGTSAGSGSAGSEGGSEGGMESTDSGGSTTNDPDTDGGSSGELMCEEADCAPCPDQCQLEQGCVDGEWSCECICPPEFCDFEQFTCDQAEQSKTPPIDCGVATLDDDIDQWNAVHDCVLAESANQNAFKGVFYLQGIDSFPRQSFIGQVGFVYALGELSQDYGGLGDPQSTIYLQPCTGLTYIPDCQVGVGFTCIQCLQQGESQILCQEE